MQNEPMELIGENEQVPAEPVEEQVTEVEETLGEESQETTVEEPSEPNNDDNAKYAAARRRAEADYRKKIEERDAEFARRFADFTNPITGAPILSEKDYFEALDAQETLNRNQQLEEAGIDPSIIDRAIANNPTVLEAQRIMLASQQAEARRQIELDFQEISRIDPDVKSMADIPPQEASEMIKLVESGLSFVDAYKLRNMDRLMSSNVNAAKKAAAQKAINDAKSKGHLDSANGVTVEQDALVDIPDNQLSRFKRLFPNDTMQQLKERYNSVL